MANTRENTNIVKFSGSSDKYSKRLILLTWVLVVFTIALVAMTGMLIIEQKESTASQNNIALNSLFFNNSNTKIINAIENSQPILTENHGQFSDVQLENYLGSFDIIQSEYDAGLLNENDFCDSFSYYIGITNKNTELQNYISAQQKTDTGFFTSVAYLANIVANSKDPNCR